jgi:DNA-binding XRE family transcriptional regulator
MSAELYDAARQLRDEGLLPDADWDEVQHLGVLGVIFVPSPETGFVTAVALLTDGCGTFLRWALAERPTLESARLAVRFLLQGLAALRRLTGQKYPWAPGADDPSLAAKRIERRRETIEAAVDEWRQRLNAVHVGAVMAARKTAADEERRRQAAAGAPIREARKRWKVTQAALAERTGIKAAVLSEIERGLRVPDEETRARLAYALDADAELLFSGFVVADVMENH